MRKPLDTAVAKIFARFISNWAIGNSADVGMDVVMWNEKQRKSRAVTSGDLRHRLNLRHSAKKFQGEILLTIFFDI